MKVLHLLKTSVGASWALRQMRELVRQGVEVHVALPPGGALVNSYRASGVEVHLTPPGFPASPFWRVAAHAAYYRQLLAALDPDIVHSHFVSTTFAMRLYSRSASRVRRIFQVPGPLHLEYAATKYAELATSGRQDYWLGSCVWTRDCYRRSGLPSDRVGLSYYGVDLDQFGRQPSGSLRTELGLGSHVRIVGMVAYVYAPKYYLGQQRGIKGHEDLIDALAICLKNDHNILGVFVGGAWNGADSYAEQVKQYARRQLGDKAIFLGNRSDVAQLYSDFDVAVHPSLSENVGGAVESLLSEVPTIATNVGGLPDLVQDRTTGWLVEPHSPAQLAGAILESLDNPAVARERAGHGAELARELFDIRKTSRQVFEFYQTMLDVGHQNRSTARRKIQ